MQKPVREPNVQTTQAHEFDPTDENSGSIEHRRLATDEP